MSRANTMTSAINPSIGMQTLMGAFGPAVPMTTFMLSTGLMTVYMLSLSAYRSSQMLSRS